MSEWISVSDAMPEFDEVVVVYYDATPFTPTFGVGFYAPEGMMEVEDNQTGETVYLPEGWYAVDDFMAYSPMHGVTHWMRIPAPPPRPNHGTSPEELAKAFSEIELSNMRADFARTFGIDRPEAGEVDHADA